jgi:hypothetical protein
MGFNTCESNELNYNGARASKMSQIAFKFRIGKAKLNKKIILFKDTDSIGLMLLVR